MGLYVELHPLSRSAVFNRFSAEDLKQKENMQELLDSILSPAFTGTLSSLFIFQTSLSLQFVGARTIRLISTRSAAGMMIILPCVSRD